MQTYAVEIEDWGMIEIEANSAKEAAEKAVNREFSTEGFRETQYTVKVRYWCGTNWRTFEVWGEPSITMMSRAKL